MSSNVPTVTLSVELPMDLFETLTAFANLLNVTVEHAAALTIMVGQVAQREMDEMNENQKNFAEEIDCAI